MSDDIELRLAKRLQQIDHGGRHTWDSCHEQARARNLEMARAALMLLKQEMGSREWDGVGPKTDCLLHVSWGKSGKHGHKTWWEHFEYLENDEDFGTGYWSESGISLSEDEEPYSPARGKLIESDDFTVTHWAPLPEVSE